MEGQQCFAEISYKERTIQGSLFFYHCHKHAIIGIMVNGNVATQIYVLAKEENAVGYIGMTEAGDAGWDLSWYDKILNRAECLGGILITKAGNNPLFQQRALELLEHKPIIIHFGCTGWGHTKMETGNVNAREYLKSMRSFIDMGFPAENIVLRVDPIIPTELGLRVALPVIRMRDEIIPDVKRIRISIYDDYHAAHDEMSRRGYEPVDDNTKWKSEMERRPTPEQVTFVARNLIATAPDQIFECCAEPEIAQAFPDNFVWTGCLSDTDLDIMGIKKPENIGINGQNRFGCRCLMMKKELLSNKKRCPNNCAYCYWGRN